MHYVHGSLGMLIIIKIWQTLMVPKTGCELFLLIFFPLILRCNLTRTGFSEAINSEADATKFAFLSTCVHMILTKWMEMVEVTHCPRRTCHCPIEREREIHCFTTLYGIYKCNNPLYIHHLMCYEMSSSPLQTIRFPSWRLSSFCPRTFRKSHT